MDSGVKVGATLATSGAGESLEEDAGPAILRRGRAPASSPAVFLVRGARGRKTGLE